MWNLKWNWNCHSMVNCSTRWDTQSTPRCGGKEGKPLWWPIASHSVSNGCSLGSLLFPHQDNLVERRTTLRVYLHNHTIPSSLVRVDDFSRNAVRQFENNKTITAFTLFRIAILKKCNFFNQEILVQEKPWPLTRKTVRKPRRRAVVVDVEYWWVLLWIIHGEKGDADSTWKMITNAMVLCGHTCHGLVWSQMPWSCVVTNAMELCGHKCHGLVWSQMPWSLCGHKCHGLVWSQMLWYCVVTHATRDHKCHGMVLKNIQSSKVWGRSWKIK